MELQLARQIQNQQSPKRSCTSAGFLSESVTILGHRLHHAETLIFFNKITGFVQFCFDMF
jgi:hypothetical protein